MESKFRAKRANAYGSQFEGLIQRSCIYYKNHEVAHIQKTPEPTKVIKPIGGGQYVMVFTKKAQPDFAGTLKDGRSIVMEAKHTNTTNVEFKRISFNQERELDLHEKLGARCLIIVAFKMKTFYVVPWTDWKQLKVDTGKKSVNEQDLKNYQVNSKNGLIDFLNHY